METLNKKRRFDAPDAYVVVFVLIALACLLTYIVPPGLFQVEEQVYLENGVEKTRAVVDIDSFEYAMDADGNPVTQGVAPFTDYYKTNVTGLLNTVFNGFVAGGAEGTAGIIAFILIIGGAFSIVIRTGAIDGAIWTVIGKAKGKDIFIIPVLSVIFALGGAMLGLAEEMIPFGIVLIPLFVKLGYDSPTGLLVVYVSTMIGFSTTWMNPFTLVIAQGIAGLPILSGATFRIIMWACFVIPLIVFTTLRALKIKKDPLRSFTYESDTKHFRAEIDQAEEGEITKFQFGHVLVLLTLGAGIAWVFYGVVVHKWFLGQMAAVFFGIGIVSGILGVAFKLNGMRINDIAGAFKTGVADIVPAAMILAFAKGITLVMGGTDNSTLSVLNTILYSAGNALEGVPTIVASWGQYLFQTLFNFLVTSGPAKAGITMPIMIPLSDVLGVSRQVSCLAYQLGDGFTNMISPTSGVLLAFLGIAKLNFVQWAKWHIKMQGVLFAGGTIFVILAVVIGYQ